MKKSTRNSLFLFIGWAMTILSVIFLAYQGVTQAYFHQDDVVELALIADWKGWQTLFSFNNEHLNVTFFSLLRVMWLVFGINHAPFLLLNILMHIFTMFLMYKITHKLTSSKLWSSIVVWGMVINANWFEVVWWITGLMIMLTTIFALISYWLVLKIRDNPKKLYLYILLLIFSILPGLSWGVGLTWPTWPFLIYGIDYTVKKINKIGWTLLTSQLIVAITYFSLVGDTLGFHTDPSTWLSKPFEIIKFVAVGISNTLVGRWLMPLESEKYRLRLIFLAIAIAIFVIGKLYKKIYYKPVLLGLVVSVGSFTTFAIPRWHFGIGHAMANYYAYFPLAFLLIAVGVFLAKSKVMGWKKITLIWVFLIHIPLSWIGFENWANRWLPRPQQTKTYFSMMNQLTPEQCLADDYIPKYVVPQPIFKTSFIWPIFKKNWNPFCDAPNVVIH